MKRREVFIELAALGTLALLPNFRVNEILTSNNLHFIGLGHGGTNGLAFVHKKGIEAKYTCITGSYVSHLKADVRHIFFESPKEYRVNGIKYMERLPLTSEMEALFSENDFYIILTGLGASVGTGLISNILELLQSEQKNYMAISSLPFKNEGRSKNEYANSKKAELESLKNVLFFDQNWIINQYGQMTMTIHKAFEKLDEQYYSIFKQHFPQDLRNNNSIG